MRNLLPQVLPTVNVELSSLVRSHLESAGVPVMESKAEMEPKFTFFYKKFELLLLHYEGPGVGSGWGFGRFRQAHENFLGKYLGERNKRF